MAGDTIIDPGGSNEPSDSPELSYAGGFAPEMRGDDNVTSPVEPKTQEELHILPVYIFTAIFGLIFILGPLFVRRGPNRSITRVCIMLSTVCCWIFWTTTYIVQMNPLLGPRLSNHSLAWIGHKWGHDAASLTAASINESVLNKDISRTMFNDTESLIDDGFPDEKSEIVSSNDNDVKEADTKTKFDPGPGL